MRDHHNYIDCHSLQFCYKIHASSDWLLCQANCIHSLLTKKKSCERKMTKKYNKNLIVELVVDNVEQVLLESRSMVWMVLGSNSGTAMQIFINFSFLSSFTQVNLKLYTVIYTLRFYTLHHLILETWSRTFPQQLGRQIWKVIYPRQKLPFLGEWEIARVLYIILWEFPTVYWVSKIRESLLARSVGFLLPLTLKWQRYFPHIGP